MKTQTADKISPVLTASTSFAPNPGLAPALAPPAPVVQTTALVQAQPVPTPVARRKIRRNGRVATLPKVPRDMVNRMLWNAVPYKNIVEALGELGYTITERNVSNWATGGYLEWSLAQEHVLQNRTNQDHLLDFLRREDAPELGEVGLQAAATRLSQVLLQKLAAAEDPQAHLDDYSRLVDLLCRLNRELTATQKLRDDSRRSLGPEYNPARVKEEDLLSALHHERFYSNPPADANLPAPPVRAAVPPMPTAAALAEEARQAREEAQLDWLKRSREMMAALTQRPATAPPDRQSVR